MGQKLTLIETQILAEQLAAAQSDVLGEPVDLVLLQPSAIHHDHIGSLFLAGVMTNYEGLSRDWGSGCGG